MLMNEQRRVLEMGITIMTYAKHRLSEIMGVVNTIDKFLAFAPAKFDACLRLLSE